MFHKPTLLCAIIITILLVLGIGFGHEPWNKFLQQKRAETFSPPYQSLADQCLAKNDPECCLNSVETMQEKKYTLAQKNRVGEDVCDAPLVTNRIVCPDSYTWCEPL